MSGGVIHLHGGVDPLHLRRRDEAQVHLRLVEGAVEHLGLAHLVDRFAAESQPIGRMTKPSEIADSVIFLCSDKAAMITGENIAVAGGQQAK